MAKGHAGGGGGGNLYFEIANFQSGMDLRKSALTAPAGTLRMLQNADISQGGEIEKRPAFQYWCDAPAGTLGLCSLNNQAFAHVQSGTAGSITPPTTSAVGVIHLGAPHGPIYLSGSISDGTGTTTAAAGTVFKVASISPAAVMPIGTAIQGTGVLAGTVITDNSGAITTGGATGTGTYAVNLSQLSFPSGAVGAAVAGVTLTVQTDFDVFNGMIYATFLASNGSYYHYYNGVQVVQGTNRGSNIRTYKNKMYGVQGRNLFFSANGDPTIWVNPSPDNSGNVARNLSGFINIGANDADSENLISMEVYYDKLAIFSSLSCQLWFLDPDPNLNQYYQTLRDAGTLAANSVRQYVANDVYFLGTHGIRSLRARDLTNTAAVADVGSPLDPVIQDLISLSTAAYVQQAIALLSPRTGRIWMIFTDKIYVLSNWASPNISAWSMYIPEFGIARQGAVFADPYVVMLTTDGRIFRFGSPGGLVYDSCPVSFTTPFLSFDKPATFKFYQGFDAICSNDPGSTWNVQASFDPTQTPTPFDQICVLDGPTIMDGRIPISGRGTHIQLQITHQAPGPATFSKLFVHYAPSDTG
jgi:hypothetical protein